MAKIHKFIGDFDLSQKELEITNQEIVNQIRKVLRLEENESIELGDGKNMNAFAKIKKIEKNNIIVNIEKTWGSLNQIRNNVTLFCTILKKENFEVVVQKTTECGISKIIPVISSRTIKTGLNIERLNKIAKEASEQSGRGSIPMISEPITFEKCLEQTGKKDLNIFFDASGELSFETRCLGLETFHSKFSTENHEHVSKNNLQVEPSDKKLKINIFIGPEGGWTEDEIKEAKNNNFKIATLGTLILRAETAAIVSTYLASNMQ